MIGCPHGCGDGYRGSAWEHLRIQGVDLMSRLMSLNKPLFVRFLKTTLIRQQPQEVMDFLHALLGFCVDPASLGNTSNASGAANVNSPPSKFFCEFPRMQMQIHKSLENDKPSIFDATYPRDSVEVEMQLLYE